MRCKVASIISERKKLQRRTGGKDSPFRRDDASDQRFMRQFQDPKQSRWEYQQ
jgi:hypothetical protein